MKTDPHQTNHPQLLLITLLVSLGKHTSFATPGGRHIASPAPQKVTPGVKRDSR